MFGLTPKNEKVLAEALSYLLDKEQTDYQKAFSEITKLQVLHVAGNRKGEHWIDSLRNTRS